MTKRLTVVFDDDDPDRQKVADWLNSHDLTVERVWLIEETTDGQAAIHYYDDPPIYDPDLKRVRTWAKTVDGPLPAWDDPE